MKRFRLRVLFQNMPNYIMMIIGALLGNVLVMFGLVLGPVLDNYQQEITSNLLADHQYLLKAQVETENKDAEKFSATTLKTIEGSLKSEEITVYGIAKTANTLTCRSVTTRFIFQMPTRKTRYQSRR